VNYKKDEEKPGAVTWKGKKIQLSYELNKYVNEKELIINGNYEVLALYSSIKITLL
jgi:hypothetical protein